MNILVIGGNGFIGSHMVDCLIQHGHRVRVYDSVHERYREPLPNVDYRISSLENIPDLYESLLGIDIVFHLACTSVPSTSNIDIIADINKNIIPTINILDLMVKLGIKRIVYFSSGGTVYGYPMTTPIGEEHQIKPISSYGILKATIERYLFLYELTHGLQPLIIRPSNPYGLRQGHFMAQGVISTFLHRVKLGEPLFVYGDGNSKKDYIYIHDFIELCYQLCMKYEFGEFNVATGTGTSLNQIIEQIKIITGKNVDVQYTEKQNYDVDHFILDISKVSRLLEPQTFTSLEDGIKILWEWIDRIE